MFLINHDDLVNNVAVCEAHPVLLCANPPCADPGASPGLWEGA